MPHTGTIRIEPTIFDLLTAPAHASDCDCAPDDFAPGEACADHLLHVGQQLRDLPVLAELRERVKGTTADQRAAFEALWTTWFERQRHTDLAARATVRERLGQATADRAANAAAGIWAAARITDPAAPAWAAAAEQLAWALLLGDELDDDTRRLLSEPWETVFGPWGVVTDQPSGASELAMDSNQTEVGDRDTIDRIATLLGTADTWPGADFLEYIADMIGEVRPHPGSGDGEGYAERFERATGRPVNFS